MKMDLLNDFSTLFAYCWYRDFPLDNTYRDMGSTSDWNIHTGLTVRRVADLMGYYAHFESGGRTDAVIRDSQNSPVLFAEWEWCSPCENSINEPEKLSNAAIKERPQFCFLFGYMPTGTLEKQQAYIEKWWKADLPLLVTLVEYEGSSTRFFKRMLTHRLDNGIWSLVREQHALSWNVAGTRWA
ncbi:hypothetical protein [Pseudomonas vanderleydeniana]|uniref:Uncharacterized protein n=1 Tax=Pseudomonas vanderleydeniana TaxID=2745495 RepID=A0A9E6PQZ4_9PSED|nr:hypothetical protein [Pseudomonas vanderleydeniana]QXI31160.1 hypothetical protein HU752_015010 [Pseudomonas vanderleydeniana]